MVHLPIYRRLVLKFTPYKFCLQIAVLFLMLSLPKDLFTQTLDLARVEYTRVPKSASNIAYNRKRVALNFPIKLNEEKEKYFFIGLDYSSIDLEFDQSFAEFDRTELEEFQILNANFTYTYKLNEDWRFAGNIMTGFSSNLSRKELISDDLSFSARVAFIKDKKDDKSLSKPYRIILGLAYSDNGGIPFPIPFVSYYKRFHTKWSFNIGVPTSNLQYHLAKNVRLKLYTQLDGFSSNIQRPILINGGEQAEQIRMAVIVGGVRAEYNIAKHVEAFFISSYIFSNNVHLRENRNKLITLNNDNRYYFRCGIRLKP